MINGLWKEALRSQMLMRSCSASSLWLEPAQVRLCSSWWLRAGRPVLRTFPPGLLSLACPRSKPLPYAYGPPVSNTECCSNPHP